MFPFLEILFCIQMSSIPKLSAEIGSYIESDKQYNKDLNYISTEIEVKAYNLPYIKLYNKANTYNIEGGLNINNVIRFGLRQIYINSLNPTLYEISHKNYSHTTNELFIGFSFESEKVGFDWVNTEFGVEINKTISGTTQLGIPQDKKNLYRKEQYASIFYAKIIMYDMLYIDFGFKTKMVDTNNYSFYPYSVSNRVEIGVLFKEFSIGWRHLCIHPEHPYNYLQPEDSFNGGYDEIFISYKIKL